MDVSTIICGRIKTGAFLLAGIFCLSFSQFALSEEATIVVLADIERSVQKQFVSGLRRELKDDVSIVVEGDSSHPEVLKSASVIVALGLDRAKAIARLRVGVPTVNSLVSKTDMDRYYNNKKGQADSTAIYIEQPPSRTLQLIQSALPGKNKLTVAVGPSSQDSWRRYESACRQRRLDCTPVNITANKKVEEALRQAEQTDGVLVLLPDPEVVNSVTARSLILNAYRRGVILVGYSQALVKAGVLMAVHSSPEQLGMDTAVLVKDVIRERGKGELPEARYPAHYSVSVNYQLARAFGLHLEAESVLLDAIEKTEKNE